MKKKLSKRKKMSKKNKSNEPLKIGIPGEYRVSVLAHCIYNERRLHALGEIFHRFGLSIYDYLKQAKKKRVI